MWSRLCIFVIVLSLSSTHVSALICGTSGQYDCQNNATCVSNVCKCATSAWTGANCTTATGCIVANTEAYSVSLGCVCLPAWNGTTCNTPSICNVTNTRDVRKGSCLCWRSWTGSDCNTCNWGTGCIAPQDINPMCYSCSTYPSSDIGPSYPDLAILVGPNDLVVSHPNTCSGGTTCNCVAGNPFLLAAAGTYCEKSYPCWAQGTGSTDGTSCNCRYNWQGDHCSWFGNGTDASTGGDLCIHTYLGFARGYCTFPPTSELSYSTSLCTGAPTPTYGLAPTYSNYTQTYPTSCTCESGAYGPFCQCGATLALGHPATNPCLNGGSCGNATLNACLCTPGYQGYICNETSSCVVANTLYTLNNICVCDQYHYGTNCSQTRVITPQSDCNPACTLYWNNVSCICKDSYTGPGCDFFEGDNSNCYTYNPPDYRNYLKGYVAFPRHDGYADTYKVCPGSAVSAYSLAYYNRYGVEPVEVVCNNDASGNPRGGPFCNSPVSEDCLNGGTSIAGGGCSCLPTYEHYICSDPTGCFSQTTSSFVNGQCVCNSGYWGRYCDYSSCGPLLNSCYGNGNCSDIHGNGTCSCTPNIGYSGSVCNETLCGLVSNPCSGNGICLDTGCLCNVTNYGSICQFTNNCDPDHTSQYDVSTSTCICKDGWHDSTCSIAPCKLTSSGSICSGSGTCVNNTCSCEVGWLGSYCTVDLCGTYDSQSSGSVCNGHGTCTNEGCVCHDSWNGTRCTIPPCANVPYGPALCGDTYGWSCPNGTCVCNPRYGGLHCEIDRGCHQDNTASYNTTTNTCICKPGAMLPYCCTYLDNPSNGPCNFGGTRYCGASPSTSWPGPSLPGTDNCRTVTSDYVDYATELISGGYSSGLVSGGHCDYGYDYLELCCPWGLMSTQYVPFLRPGDHLGQCVTPYFDTGNQLSFTACGRWNGGAWQYGSPNKCVHGNCTDYHSDGYIYCTCQPGASGFWCNHLECNEEGTNIQLYDAFPYRNSDTCECKDGWSSLVCSCPPPFKPWGTSPNDTVLVATTCGGFSTCNPAALSNACSCPSGHNGTYCCKDGCNGHGVCSLNATTSIPYCACDVGWSGDTCGTALTSVYCPNGCGNGQCLYVNFTYDLTTKLGYKGDYVTLWNNASLLFLGTTMHLPVQTISNEANTLYWFIRSGRFQMERFKLESYGSIYTFNYIVSILFKLVPDIYYASKLDYSYIADLTSYIMDRSFEKQYAAVSLILTYGANVDASTNTLKPLYPVTERPFMHCVCNPSSSGKDCSSSCPISSLTSRPCTMLNYGDFHGVCTSVVSPSCLCTSRYSGDSTCSSYIGDGCFPSRDILTKCNGLGTCTQNNGIPGNYSCVCRSGVTGTYCDTYICSGNNIECSQVPNAVCQASGVCDCAVSSQLAKSNSLTNKPLLPVGQNCQYNAIDQCGNAVALVSGGYQWKECNGRGTCTNDTSHAQPYCVCQSGYSGPQCTNTACSPACNNNQNCNSATGTCSCQSKWSTPSGCTSGNRTCECTLSLCGHGVPDSTGTSCICDEDYRLDSSGLCTIVQCPLIAMTDNGEVPCNVTLHGICASTSPSTAATQSHQTGCCYDACRSSQGISRCSLNASQPVCACNPTAAFNQVNGICYSKCNGQAASTDDTFGYRCGPCLTSFFIQDPWNSATDFMDANCKRSRCLNGGTVAATNANCNCPSGFTGILCQTATTGGGGGVSSSSSSSTATSSSSTSSTYSSSAPSTAGSSTIVSSTVVPSMSSSSSSMSSSTSPSTHSSSTTTGLSLSSSSSSSSTANGNNTVTDTSSSPVLSTGGIVGVAIGSTIVAGAIGYSVYWTFWIKPIAAKYGAV